MKVMRMKSNKTRRRHNPRGTSLLPIVHTPNNRGIQADYFQRRLASVGFYMLAQIKERTPSSNILVYLGYLSISVRDLKTDPD